MTLATGALALAFALPGPGQTSGAAAQGSEAATVVQTDGSITADHVTMFGTSPAEANDETWGIGRYNEQSLIVRYTPEAGWSRGPELQDSSGSALPGFALDHPEGFRYPAPSPLAGQMTPDGSGALAGAIPASGSSPEQQVLLVREPGGPFKETAALPSEPQPPEKEQEPTEQEPALLYGERLYGLNHAPMVTALEEAGTSHRAGALVVPVEEGGKHPVIGVRHWDGSSWTLEAIEIPKSQRAGSEALAIGASSPTNAWLLVKLSPAVFSPGSVALFRRHLGTGGEATSWRPVAPKTGGEAGEPLAVEGKGLTVPSGDQAQVLTVTSDGVWIDGVRRDVPASTTAFFKPEGEAAGNVVADWCKLPANAPEGTAPCKYELPEPLPTGPSRSYAWANSSTPEGLGERVISGLAEGVSLRLEGTEFKEVLALGGSPPPADVGGSYGAAFSSQSEGWLGQEQLPVHVSKEHSAPSHLASWPVPFRHALLAVAPQPGVPVGSLSSEALAVGDQGEVARYLPGKGWLPESLLGPGGRHQTPQLRAVAWPSAQRAYAVGDEGQMWLWRGETGLWEQDPATPLNFRGNLLGIAFDAANPARGYAIGQGGVLLRYGKTWSQESEGSIPESARGASFTSIAFAGSEALVAYRKLVKGIYQGGVISNNGSGWQADQSAASAMGSNVPWTVAGLADGGAAFTASGAGQGAQVYERQSAASGWQSTPYPGTGEPGSLALFREGGTLRAIGAGTVPFTLQIDNEAAAPPGFPPTLVAPYPPATSPEKGVFRQTGSGWSDEEHELNNAKEGPGQYTHYDSVYQPDPVAALLVNPEGGNQGWAIGGVIEDEAPQLDTADVERYGETGATPPGIGSAPVSGTGEAGLATFAIGGGAQCGAPCARRANARIGPDVWLTNALQIAGERTPARAFLDMGPRVTNGETVVGAELVIPYARELGRYAQVLGSGSKPAYAAASPTDLDGAQSEATFEAAFSGFPQPFGGGSPGGEMAPAARSSEGCAASAAGCHLAYYSMNSGPSGAEVRVVVLDDTTEVGEPQTEWLRNQLAEAKSSGEPAIVVGNKPASSRVAEILVTGGASAYFFESPEQNVELPLRAAGGEIPSFGSGTLGYVNYSTEAKGDFIGQSGFLLAQVNVAAAHAANTTIAPVAAKLIPNVGELAMEAQDGTLLRRSQAALFDALARRPRSGDRAHHQSSRRETSPYIPIPSNCVGGECAKEVPLEYTFSSSRPEIGDFVKPNLAVSERTPELGARTGEPVPDSKSGLFCAYNPGTTTVTISAGGRSASLPVTVQAGSVRQPCGTVRANVQPNAQQAAPVPPPPAPAPAPAGPAPSSAPPVLPIPPSPAAVVPAPPPPAVHPTPRPPLSPFFLAPTPAILLPAIVPPPLPAPANPTPPSGTSAVTSPVEAAQKEEEEESAPESVSNQAVAYRAAEHEPSPLYILGVVLIAAFAGASLRGRPGRRRREVRVAHATVNATHAQRRSQPPRARRR